MGALLPAGRGVMTGTFDFTDKGGGGGNATLVKVSTPTEAASWGELKSRYGDR